MGKGKAATKEENGKSLILFLTSIRPQTSQVLMEEQKCDDAYARLFAAVEFEIDATLQKSELASTEKNRASAVAMNAEIRWKKARLMDEVPKLCKLAQKKIKWVAKEELAVRDDLILGLSERIQAIPDGSTSAAKQSGGGASSSSHQNIKFDSSDGNFESDFFQQSEESSQFRREYEMRKMKQA